MSTDEDLSVRLQRKLVENGEWDRIMIELKRRLNERGILDELTQRNTEAAHTMDNPTFRQILQAVKGDAHSSVPLAVRKELLSIIKSHFDGLFSK